MTFVAAICGKLKLGGHRMAMIRLDEPSYDHAVVEAHRIAHRDNPGGYRVVIQRLEDLPTVDSPIQYAPVTRDRDREFNPDCSPTTNPKARAR